MRKLFLIIAGAAAIAATVFVGAVFLASRLPAPRSYVNTSVEIGVGPLNLVDTRGRRVTEKDLIGKPSVIYFGFTYCPEVCPTTLAAMTTWLKALGPDADKLNVIFVTIDPERDTPKKLGLYLSSFDPHIRGLTGSLAEVGQAAHNYNVYFQKVTVDGGGYTMDHSTTVYLMDRQGRLADVIGYQEPSADAIAKLRRLVRG
jgi:protein SCO1/2